MGDTTPPPGAADLRGLFDFPWKVRRYAILSVAIFSGAVILILLFLGEDSPLHRDSNFAAWGTLVYCLGIFVYGANKDDQGKRDSILQAMPFLNRGPLPPGGQP